MFHRTGTLLSLLSFGFASVIVSATLSADAQTFTNQSVASSANIFGAGSATNPGGGTTAPGFSLTPGVSYVEFTSVTGLASLSTGIQTVPDGVQQNGSAPFNIILNVNSAQGISGIRLDKGSGFLSGVFLSDATPTNPAPARLLFTNNGASGSVSTDFTDLSPLLNQQFFIGDGLTGNGSGATQKFFVPTGATRLFLGFADAGGYNGDPGGYFDNSGALTVSLRAVPAPSALAAFVIGVVPGAAVLLRRRRKA